MACSLAFALCMPATARAAFAGEIQQTTRLSTWLAQRLEQADSGEAPYLPGLVWTVPDERIAQEHARINLLGRLEQPELSPDASQAARAGVVRFVSGLQATGRVVLEKTDPRWLEVHPDKDPVLQKGQRIILSDRPKTVTVVFGDGRTCQIRHDVNAFARNYIDACDADADPRRVWLVQPDGIVQRRGIALWDMERQDPPAPGAWLLVEEPRYPWHPVIYEQLARLLATQGPAGTDTSQPILAAPFRTTGLLNDLMTPGTPRDLPVTSGDWGSIGVMQTPTARMAPAGEASISINHTLPYTRLNFNLQPLDWFETTFRYVDVSNRLFGPTIAGSQSFKDKSIDVKLRLSRESEYLPQLALGIRDVAGTGLFSGEYVVASKRAGNFDWSGGFGWGYLGARGNLSNPLSFLGSSFETRPTANTPTGGQVNFKTFFHGPTALFGGVQYHTPWDKLILKLEYDGNDYQHEPLGNNQPQTSPINIGAVYRYSDNVDLDLGFERGNTLMLGASFHGRMDRMKAAKTNDPKPVPVSDYYPTRDPHWQRLTKTLEESTGWHVHMIRRAGSELIVRFDQVDAFYWNDYIDRIVSILHQVVSGRTLVFRIQSVDKGLKLQEFLIDRHTWVEAKTRYLPPYERRNPVLDGGYKHGFVDPYDETLLNQPLQKFHGDYGLYMQNSLGGPNNFLLYQVGVQLTGTWRPSPNTWLTGQLHGALIDNYNKFSFTAASELPRVRTNIREYETSSKINMPVLQLTHVGRLDENQYYSVYGGMLESMFGGVGGEWLYRPYRSSLALGVDINAVRQRGFKQDFSFQDYQTTTGHLSLYWDTGVHGILATLQAGRYLAGDVGATLDVSRVFSNGVKMGAWFTKTNVPAAVFGEGSYDKGIYVSIPFDAMMTRSSTSFANLVWQPLVRDGGARLDRSVRLIDLTRDVGGFDLRWGPFDRGHKNQFGDVDDESGDPWTKKSVFNSAWDDLSMLGRGMGYADFWKSVLLAGGITAASSVLDKPADRLAKHYGQSRPMKAEEKIGNLIPFLAAGVSGLLMLEDDDPTRSRASFASVEASGVALATTLGLKYAIGRARPSTEQGPASFNFLSSANGNTSMPSIHSTLAWAAITPYAKAYDAPWLYGVAALTNVARIGGRDHWFSDTVGSALIGYGLGSLFWESRSHDKASPSLYVLPSEIGLEWKTP